MTRFLVAGLLNVETTLRVESIPIAYEPVRYNFHGIDSAVSGVGFNLCKALVTLGNDVALHALLGDDLNGRIVRAAVRELGVDDTHLLTALDATPQSVIAYEPSGRRMIFSDLKSIQEAAYPPEHIAWDSIDMAVLANLNAARPLLALAQAREIPIATDVHAISDLDDPYNRDFMAAADILFMSHERLPEAPPAWIQRVQATYQTPLIVIGMGAEGALLAVRDDARTLHIPAVAPRGVVNTVGSGDALFASFVHSYAQTGDPYLALRKASVFAGYKVGSSGGAAGFLTADALDALYKQHQTELLS